jgi:hypothetical protein
MLTTSMPHTPFDLDPTVVHVARSSEQVRSFFHMKQVRAGAKVEQISTERSGVIYNSGTVVNIVLFNDGKKPLLATFVPEDFKLIR